MAATIRPIEHSDDDLLRRIRAGDEEAFTTVYRGRQGAIYRFALHMSGSHSVAEEVTQEVFMTLLDDHCSFDSSRGTLSGYLFGVARNLVWRRLEKERVYVALSEEGMLPAPLRRTNGNHHASLAVPAPDSAREDVIERVRQAVLRLPASYREVVVLCDLQEMRYEEAAKILDCAVGTVRSRLHRARSLLAKKMREARSPEERLVAGETASP